LSKDGTDTFDKNGNLRRAIKRDAINMRARRRKWSDGGGTGLVDWTGDLGPGLQVDHTKVVK
jgi:hypothetical protein